MARSCIPVSTSAAAVERYPELGISERWMRHLIARGQEYRQGRCEIRRLRPAHEMSGEIMGIVLQQRAGLDKAPWRQKMQRRLGAKGTMDKYPQGVLEFGLTPCHVPI